MDLNLANLDQKELKRLIDQANKLMEARAKGRAEEVRRKLEALAKEEGYDLYQLLEMAPAKVRRPAKPKYADPADPTRTWTGRGLKPKWAKAHLEAGGQLEDLLIKG